MDLLENRKGGERMIFNAFINRTLQAHSKKIYEQQQKNMPPFSDKSYEKRTFAINDNSLIYSHKGILRLMDMKRISYPNSNKKYIQKRIYPTYNKVFTAHYNAIMKNLAYNFTDDIISELKNEVGNKN
ncbi:Uncharacterised protein [Chryseobacterium nakagawai]|uniref:Uncharacterized protein n=1 Tax=Chryseobacterium nakagawai TaxID=1241982 RepID=A0AAD0YPP7_CHRNA|nr:hypothetical protein [Chryseobacterium nakagawai]AZA93045.1 hypothetical protein EG343_21795 [Chryseobacterium nakagawai]VEH19678.1 Uncharacterised protein [Chryseobacterium nakagawai]